jgi:LuxR family maltose regulon positive regulatory protein
VPKFAYRTTPIVVGGYLYTNDGYTGTAVNTPTWFVWLALGQTFYYETPRGSFTARREQRRNGAFWYAFRRIKGKLRKGYLGSSTHLTRETLDRATARLAP